MIEGSSETAIQIKADHRLGTEKRGNANSLKAYNSRA